MTTVTINRPTFLRIAVAALLLGSTAIDGSAQQRRAGGSDGGLPPRDEWQPDVYPRYNPGPNAVRDCTVTYVQEYRPSGTVITPRMNCYWRPG